MKQGFLSQYFEGIATKRLSTVEVNPSCSHQHEFNGSKALRDLLGSERLTGRPALFLLLSEENEIISSEGSVTWYDARESHPTRTEYRLYFKSNPVMYLAEEDDLLVVAKRTGGKLYMIVVKADSSFENQVLWLFGVSRQVDFTFTFQPIEDANDIRIDLVARYILEELGIEIEELNTAYLDTIIEPYLAIGFPSTKAFSELARRTIRDVSVLSEPDETLLAWMEHEEKLFKRLERHIVGQRLEQGFVQGNTTDVDGFIQFSLSVHNRRKSRVGYALENHLEEIFKSHQLSYSRNEVTENKSKPDFLFPSIASYRDPSFHVDRLSMLGVKSTCKDRWRQVLSEATRIERKHLLTLEPSISENQTSEMQASHLQLVLPQRLHDTYTPVQQSWLMNLDAFIQMVKER